MFSSVYHASKDSHFQMGKFAHFHPDIVTSISRVPSLQELTLLSQYENQVSQCCAPKQTNTANFCCNLGRKLSCTLLERFVYGSDGRLYCTRSQTQTVIEIPLCFRHARLLLRSGGYCGYKPRTRQYDERQSCQSVRWGVTTYWEQERQVRRTSSGSVEWKFCRSTYQRGSRSMPCVSRFGWTSGWMSARFFDKRADRTGAVGDRDWRYTR